MSGTAGNERMQEAASGLIDQAGRTAEAQASRTMTQAGETLHRVADAVRDAGTELRGERPEIANVADTAANQVERAAMYLREHDAAEVWNAATDAARRQPMLVVGGALLAGLALGRFLRTATEAQGSRYGGSSGSRLGSGTYAGMNASYGGASSYGGSSSRYDTDRALASSTAYENRTSELEGTGADYSTGGTSTRPSRSTSSTQTGSSRSTATSPSATLPSGSSSSSTQSSSTSRRGRSSSSTSSGSSKGS